MSSVGSILSNAGALAALNGIAQSQGATGSLETQLSTGLSINSPADSPAGYIQAQGLISQINGFSQSTQNLNEGVSLLQTAQGGISQQESILQKLNSIAVAAANGSLTPQQRIADQGVVSNLLGQMNDIANQTQFNGINLLNGTLSGLQFQAGSNQGQTLNLSIPGTRASSLAVAPNVDVSRISRSGYVNWGNTPTSDGFRANHLGLGSAHSSLRISGSKGSALIPASDLVYHFHTGETYQQFIDNAINNVSSKTGVTTYTIPKTNVVINTSGATGSIYINETGFSSSKSLIALNINGGKQAAANEFNQKNSNPNITAVVNGSGNLDFQVSNGSMLDILDTKSGNTGSISLNGSKSTNNFHLTDLNYKKGEFAVYALPQIHFKSNHSFKLSGGELNYIGISGQSVNSSQIIQASRPSSGPATLAAISILSQSSAEYAITTIQSALNQLGSIQGYLGANQQRFQAQIGVLQTANINTQNGLAAIQDANIPQVVSQMTQEQIQNQAGVAALKSSNSLQQSFLSLLP